MKRVWMIGLAGLVLLLAAGCGRVRIEPRHQGPPPAVIADQDRLEQAVMDYRQERYDRALEAFDALSRSAATQTLRRRALYGRACTLLVTADGDEQAYQKALDAWEDWSQAVSERPEEDPRLLEPLLRRPPRQVLVEQETPAEQETVADKDAPVPVEPAGLDKLRQENQRLRRQLEALEALQQELDQRKKELQ